MRPMPIPRRSIISFGTGLMGQPSVTRPWFTGPRKATNDVPEYICGVSRPTMENQEIVDGVFQEPGREEKELRLRMSRTVWIWTGNFIY